MKKFFFSILLSACAAVPSFAEQAPATFIGDQQLAVEIRGSSWLRDYTSIGWSVGTYRDAPKEIHNSLVLYNYSHSNLQIQPGSKLILKVNGEPMVLTTAQGTYYDGSTHTEAVYDRLLGWVNYYGNTVYYDVTQEQADAINTYGITKYRYQVDQTVFERDEMNASKIAKKMKRTYDGLVETQTRKASKIDDLSDF